MKLKNLFFSIAALSVWSFSALAIAPPSSPTTPVVVTPAKDVSPAAKKQLQIAQMKWFTSLTVTDYAKIRGKKLNIFEKASFKLTQYRMKQQLRHSETTLGDPNWGGLALGFFLGIIGVLLAYIFSTNRDFIKWTWYGFALGLIIWLLIIVI